MSSARNIASKVLSHIPIVNYSLKLSLFNQRNKKYPNHFSALPKDEEQILNTILDQGYYVIPDYFDADWCDRCQDVIRTVVEKEADFVHVNEDRRLFGAENLSDDFMKFYNDPFLSRMADAYYGKKSMIGVTLANWIWKDDKNQFGSGGDWHRDRMLRQFKVLVYLTDVTEKTGAFQIIEKSNTHNKSQFAADAKAANDPEVHHRLTGEQVEQVTADNPDRLKTITGGKGSVVLVDTSAIHRGSPVQEGERMAMFNYYYMAEETDTKWSEKKFSPRVPKGFKLSDLDN